MIDPEFYNRDYFEAGPQTNKSLYQNYRWMPELTIPLAYRIVHLLRVKHTDTILDFGCAKGYLVHALRLLDFDAYGVDVSEYAINQALPEVQPYLRLINLLDENFNFHTHILCKDVLEHIPYEHIDEQLRILRNKCSSIFAIVPLGENGKYVIPAYELDQSHYIREPLDWWKDRFQKAGFNRLHYTHNLGLFKANWHDVNNKGNGLIYAP